MSWRSTFLTGILAAGLMQTGLLSPFASTAWADEDHDHHHDHRRHYDYTYHDHDGDHDHDRWWHEHHESDRDGHVHGDNTRDCGAIHERIRYDSEQVREIDPAKHPKARQWYKGDIRNAENDLRNCRH